MPHPLVIVSQSDYLTYCWYKFTYWMANSTDPDQLASSEANWSGSTLFAKAGHVRGLRGTNSFLLEYFLFRKSDAFLELQGVRESKYKNFMFGKWNKTSIFRPNCQSQQLLSALSSACFKSLLQTVWTQIRLLLQEETDDIYRWHFQIQVFLAF